MGLSFSTFIPKDIKQRADAWEFACATTQLN